MDVAFFSESYVPTRDGVASVVHSLARALQRLGHGVRVFTPQPAHGAPSDEITIDGVSVIRPRSLPVPLYAQYRWALWPFAALKVERLPSEVDVVHLHTPGIMGSAGFLAARRFGKPLVGTFHTNVWEARHSFPGSWPIRLFFRAARWYSLGTYYRCDLTTAPTRAAREALIEHCRKPFRRPVEVVPNGIELERFHPGVSTPDWRERCGLPTGVLMTYMGRLTVDKGVHRFLDALETLDRKTEWAAIIAGAGPEEANVRNRIRGSPFLAGRARFIGPVAEEEKAALLSQSEMFVLPSTSDTSSVALLEAMASGAACVASDTGGPADLVVPDETGLLVNVERRDALGAAIQGLVNDGSLRRQLSEGGRRYVSQTASIDVTAARFVELYQRLISERRGRAAI